MRLLFKGGYYMRAAYISRHIVISCREVECLSSGANGFIALVVIKRGAKVQGTYHTYVASEGVIVTHTKH